ncbi:hypothetical protein [Cognatiyoonia sp. IB215446]|uniref:hypothetical protein n=1 Tax=Cognatiyoonia sp. IB215446 TaxID=3097355 RepID=UPI002A241893|nr:hypothetical protein [Cognatiyoonia sp. IB215446]
MLADGTDWTTTSEKEPSCEVVVFPDGSGRMNACGLSLGMSWTPQGGKLCITARFRRTQCADLVKTAQGIRAERDGGTIFTLSR